MAIEFDPGRVACLLDLARDCDACEQSWSFHAGGVEERFLFFFEQKEETALRLARAAVTLGFPEGLLAGWSRALPGADAVGLAVNREGSSVRLYVQYWEAVRRRAMAGDLQPVPLYLGFKALPSGALRVDGYICHPAAARGVFWPEMAAGMAAFGLDPALAEAAFAPLSAANCIYTRTISEARRSWLATVRRAELEPERVETCLAPLAQRPGAETFSAALWRGAPMLHLAGGQDEAKGDFLTIYLEAEPEEIGERLIRPIP